MAIQRYNLLVERLTNYITKKYICVDDGKMVFTYYYEKCDGITNMRKNY